MAEKQSKLEEIVSSWHKSADGDGTWLTVVKGYDDAAEASKFLEELVRANIPPSLISVLIQRPAYEFHPPAVLSHLFRDSIVIAGIGAVYVHGPINDLLREPSAFDAPRKNGIAEALQNWGISSTQALTITSRLEAGDVMVIVRVPIEYEKAYRNATVAWQQKMSLKSVMLRLGSQGHVPVADFGEMLSACETAYNSLTLLEHMDGPALLRYTMAWEYQPLEDSRGKLPLRIPLKDRLILGKVQLSSPGFLELLGALNPLECIRHYLQERHEREKDRSYKDTAEATRMALENRLLENKVIKERLEIGYSVGLTNAELAPLIHELVIRPLARLDRYQTEGLITSATLQEIESSPSRAR